MKGSYRSNTKGAGFLVVMAGLLTSCVVSNNEISVEMFEARAENYSKKMLRGSPHEAKKASWDFLTLLEEVSDDVYENLPNRRVGRYEEMAVIYASIAEINRAEGKKEVSDALYEEALVFWSRSIDQDGTWGEQKVVVNRQFAQWLVDTFDYDSDVVWRNVLDHPPTLYFPKYELNENGVLERVEEDKE